MKGRTPFHQHVIDEWPMPRRKDEAMVYNFGSDDHLIVITFRGDHYSLDWWEHTNGEASGEAGFLDAGSIAWVCEEAEDFMRATLRDEGKDLDDFC